MNDFLYIGGIMNSGVVYFSRTGNTKKLAEAIAGTAGCTAADISAFDATGTFDILFIGSAVYGGKLEPEFSQFIENLNSAKVKRAALFTTYAFGESASVMIKALLKEKGIDFDDTVYTCRGRFLFFNRKRPDGSDLEGAKKFAEMALSKTR
jgi:flavodoxin